MKLKYKVKPVPIFLGLGSAYLFLAAAMNDAEMPYLFVFFTAGVALLHFIAAKLIYDRRI